MEMTTKVNVRTDFLEQFQKAPLTTRPTGCRAVSDSNRTPMRQKDIDRRTGG
jgi:hypothetical protein